MASTAVCNSHPVQMSKDHVFPKHATSSNTNNQTTKCWSFLVRSHPAQLSKHETMVPLIVYNPILPNSPNVQGLCLSKHVTKRHTQFHSPNLPLQYMRVSKHVTNGPLQICPSCGLLAPNRAFLSCHLSTICPESVNKFE